MPKLPPPRSSTLEERMVTIVVRDTGAKRNLKAKVYGSLCLYRAPENNDYWSVGHTPTGLRVASFKEEGDGLRMMKHLWDSYSLAFREKTKEGVVSKLAPWVISWLKRCNNEGFRWIDPPREKPK